MKTRKTLEDIEKDFKLSIVTPKNISSKQFLFCPVGLVGAGKTTVTKPISDRLGLVRVSSDELRKMLKESGYGYSSVKEIVFRIARKLAERGLSISFDMDCGNPEVKKFTEDLAMEFNIKIVWVHINTPEIYIFEKFRKHPPSWLADNPQAMIDNYYTQKEKRTRENIKFEYFCVFDTSRSDLNEKIDKCVEKIKNEILS